MYSRAGVRSGVWPHGKRERALGPTGPAGSGSGGFGALGQQGGTDSRTSLGIKRIHVVPGEANPGAMGDPSNDESAATVRVAGRGWAPGAIGLSW